MLRVSFVSSVAALIAFVLSAMMVNHGLVDSSLPDGPGLTLDESFNIDQGVYLVDALGQHGPLLVMPSVAKEVFGSPRYLPDHPPLGRLILGISHQLISWLVPGSESTLYNVPAARLGSCFAFAMVVLLLSEFAHRRYGAVTGLCTAVMLIGMPHLIGHARLAALESTTNLAWVAAILPLLAWWTDAKPPTMFTIILSGGLCGLLLLTKVQGVFIPPIICLWAVWQYRSKAVVPLFVYGIAAATIFLACWPWLWLDPIPNVMRYLGRTTDRPTLYCWYFGQRYADKMVPWHFPFVMTLTALPAWTLVGLAIRGFKRRLDTIEQFLLLSVLFPLVVFAVPGVPVYDGTRLFLIVMPAICLLAARGFALWLCVPGQLNYKAKTECIDKPKSVVVGTLCTICIASCYWIMQPLTISQYGLLAAGDRGAATMGMESCYWSDALNGDFWKQVPEDSTIYVAPVSHQFQLSDIESLVPVVQQRNIKLVPFEYDRTKQKGLLLLIHRLADLRVSLQSVPEGATVVAEVTRDGIVMARLIDTTHASLPDPLE